MSTITMSTPARQPMASLNGARFRNLTNVKNSQACLSFTMPSPLKRRTPGEFDHVDQENIDPRTFSMPSKKTKSFDFELTKSEKTPVFTLPPFKKSAQYVERPQAAGNKRKAEDTSDTNTGNVLFKHQRVAPSSPPTPAGRSPKSKKTGILSRRRMTSSPFTRINPPAFTVGEPQNKQPFSIDAALAGTVPAVALKSKSGPRTKEWYFDIHEDTPHEEMAILMEHSTCTLDISDDESRSSLKGDKDDKENIPPIDGPATLLYSSTQVAATRRDMMTDEPRTPLGDLAAQDFYATGCDATSVILTPAEDADENAVENADEKNGTACNIQQSCSPSRPRADAITEAAECWKVIVEQFNTHALATDNKVDVTKEQDASNDEATKMDIWESESAKGDDEVTTEPQAENTARLSVLA